MLILVLRDHTLRNTRIDSWLCRAVKDDVGKADWTHLVWASYITVRNSNFVGNGETLGAFKPKQVNDTIRSVCVYVCVFLFFFLITNAAARG